MKQIEPSENKIKELISLFDKKKFDQLLKLSNELIDEFPVNTNFYYTSINMERGMTYSEIVQNVGRNIIFDNNPKRLVETVRANCSEKDLILITGSNFIAKSIL